MTYGIQLILIGCLSFGIVLGFVNSILKRQYAMSYTTAPVSYVVLYATSSIALLLMLANQQLFIAGYETAVAICVLVAGYCVFGVMQHERMSGLDHCQMFGIPPTAQIELCPTAAGQTVKITEICFQQLCALMILSGLLALGLGLLAMTVLFTVIVFVIHIPSWWLFGRLFGGFFIWSSTGLATVYPTLMVYTSYSFTYMLMIHVAVYILWYSYLIRYYTVPHKKALG